MTIKNKVRQLNGNRELGLMTNKYHSIISLDDDLIGRLDDDKMIIVLAMRLRINRIMRIEVNINQEQNTFMYNIDFKVSGQIVSIHVAANDTLGSLVDQMKNLSQFNKYPCTELQAKLTKNLIHISSTPSIDIQIKKRLHQLLNPNQNPKSIPHHHKATEPKPNLDNNTFVNLLQQNTINNSYLERTIVSQTQLKRKYISNSPLENQQDFIQHKLKFNYDQPKSSDNHQILPEKNPSIHPTYNKRSFSYLQQQQQPVNTKNPYHNYPIKDFFQKGQNQNQTYFSRKPSQKSPLKPQKAYFYELEKQTIPQNDYNPVPKLNELIQRTKSLSMMTQKNSGLNLKQRNINIQTENRKILHNSEPLAIQKRKTVGRIQHRQDVSTLSSNKDVRQQKSFTRSKENQTKERQRLYEREEFQLKMNYNTEKVSGVSQKMGIRSLLNQKEVGSGREIWVQNKRREGVKKGIYSYL